MNLNKFELILKSMTMPSIRMTVFTLFHYSVLLLDNMTSALTVYSYESHHNMSNASPSHYDRVPLRELPSPHASIYNDSFEVTGRLFVPTDIQLSNCEMSRWNEPFVYVRIESRITDGPSCGHLLPSEICHLHK